MFSVKMNPIGELFIQLLVIPRAPRIIAVSRLAVPEKFKIVILKYYGNLPMKNVPHSMLIGFIIILYAVKNFNK